jgi:N-acetylneuraminate synthase
MMSTFRIVDRPVGLGQPPYVIAQLDHSALSDAGRAMAALEAAAAAGAEAVDIQAPAMLDDAVVRALVRRAAALGTAIVATHYSEADLCSALTPRAAAHGLAYPALVHQGLVAQAASSQCPLLVNTEACELGEIKAAYAAARAVGGRQMAILHHVGGEAGISANLHTLLDMSFRFDTVIGVADRSPGATVAVAAVALGASIVAKPFALEAESVARGALTPPEFSELTAACKAAWQALGLITYGLSDAEKATRAKRMGSGNLMAG